MQSRMIQVDETIKRLYPEASNQEKISMWKVQTIAKLNTIVEKSEKSEKKEKKEKEN